MGQPAVLFSKNEEMEKPGSALVKCPPEQLGLKANPVTETSASKNASQFILAEDKRNGTEIRVSASISFS